MGMGALNSYHAAPCARPGDNEQFLVEPTMDGSRTIWRRNRCGTGRAGRRTTTAVWCDERSPRPTTDKHGLVYIWIILFGSSALSSPGLCGRSSAIRAHPSRSSGTSVERSTATSSDHRPPSQLTPRPRCGRRWRAGDAGGYAGRRWCGQDVGRSNRRTMSSAVSSREARPGTGSVDAQ